MIVAQRRVAINYIVSEFSRLFNVSLLTPRISVKTSNARATLGLVDREQFRSKRAAQALRLLSSIWLEVIRANMLLSANSWRLKSFRSYKRQELSLLTPRIKPDCFINAKNCLSKNCSTSMIVWSGSNGE